MLSAFVYASSTQLFNKNNNGKKNNIEKTMSVTNTPSKTLLL